MLRLSYKPHCNTRKQEKQGVKPVQAVLQPLRVFNVLQKLKQDLQHDDPDVVSLKETYSSICLNRL